MNACSERISEVLSRVSTGDVRAADQLLPLLYDELRRLANYQIQRLGHGQSLQATDLVHEAYLKLVGTEDRDWESRCHFINAAGSAMRSILVDRLRRKSTRKHGAEFVFEPMDELVAAFERQSDEVLAVDQALCQLEQVDERSARVVILRFFLGMSEPEVADVLGLSDRTVRRDWCFARAWLGRALEAC